jgi:23S rRNA G2445 N2-methylase RlmL
MRVYSRVTQLRGRDALRDALRARGFTPARGETDAVVELLADPDDAVAREAERALARLGLPVLARFMVGSPDADARVRAGTYRVAGRIAPRGQAEAAWLIRGLEDPDPRARRHAANALGKLRSSTAASAIEGALLAAWDRAPSADMQRAIAASFGRLGSVHAVDRLRSVGSQDPNLSRVTERAALTIARDRTRGEASSIDPDRMASVPTRVVFFCRTGLERIVAEEAREHGAAALDLEAPRRGEGRVFASLKGALGDLFRVRTAMSFAIALGAVPIEESPAIALAAALDSDEARRALETWTVGTVRYRIAWAGGGHRRSATWSAARAIAARRPEWINDPTASTWEVVAREDDRQLYVELSPRGLDDPRFTYRVQDVPAASHPTLAAALVRTAGVRDDDVVWDPFMGSGVELVERARAGRYARLVGSDTDPRALDAARANFAAAGVQGIRVELADAIAYAPPKTTLIITNPPMGRRLLRDGSLGTMLDRFVDHASVVLSRGGRLVWLSPFGTRTSERARACGLTATLEEVVDMGGFPAHLQCFVRR